VIIVASDDRDNLDDEVARIEGTIYSGRTNQGGYAKPGVRLIYKQQGATLPQPLAGHEHFGFLDGVSQPGLRGRLSEEATDVLTPRRNPHDPDQGKPGQDLIWPGEFVFGYPGQTSDAQGKVSDEGPDSLRGAGPVWAKDSSYLVIRRLRQNVEGFHRFLEGEARRLTEKGYNITADLLGAKLVGRSKSGAPVLRAPDTDNSPLADDHCANNHCTFKDPSWPVAPVPPTSSCAQPSAHCVDKKHPVSPGDPNGLRCPFAAHIRKTYPRDDTGTLSDEIGKVSTQTHRLLRRGIPYGAQFYPPRDPSRVRDSGDRGLVFAAYQTSIVEQFEFVQRAWANNPEFKDKSDAGSLVSGHDLIIGQANHSDGSRTRQFVLRLVDGQALEHSEIISIPTDWVIPTGGGTFSLHPLMHYVS
jgi:Dyp-type peroxidase family